MRRLLPILGILMLSACAVGPDFMPAMPELPDWWNDASAQEPLPTGQSNVTTASDPDPLWWRSFGDPELNSLIERAVKNNPTVQQTVLRISEARQEEIQAEARGLPHLNGNFSYMHEQLGLKGLVRETGSSFGGGAAGGSTGGFSVPSQFFQPVDLFQDSVNASWELDLFGSVRRSVEEAQANTESTIEAHNDALVSLEAQVAQSYAQLRGAEAQSRIAAEDVKVETDVLALTRRREARGLASDLDVDNAQTQLDTTTAGQPQFIQQEEVAANALCVLLGLPPGSLNNELDGQTVPTLPPDIPIGIPSSLAQRRPDIRQAEAQLHAATAALGVAVAQTYPDVTLTGAFGTRALEGEDLAHWANVFYSAGPQVSLPIFQGGALTAQIALTDAQQAEAALNYQKVVLNALQEVENALAAYRSDRARQISLRDTVRSAADGLYLAKDRYDNGLSSFIDVLTTENQLVTARQQLTDANLAVTVDVVMLYRALGGGYQTTGKEALPPLTPTADETLKHLFEQ